VDEREHGRFAYISSGTWSLLGVETDAPIITAAVRDANYTNEGGVFGKTRLLRNIMGLWILQECRRTWRREGIDDSFSDLALKAEKERPFLCFFDPDDDAFLAPGDMPSRICEVCRLNRQPAPQTPAQFARAIYENLALKYRWAIERLSRDILGEPIERVYIVGGGSNNALLNSMAARAFGVPVYAGPSEATAIGNILMQAAARGELSGLADIRQVVRSSFAPTLYEPTGRHSAPDESPLRSLPSSDEWDNAYANFLMTVGLPA
jgi:rhamnulokinase